MKVRDGRSALNHGSPFGSQISKKSPEALYGQKGRWYDLAMTTYIIY